MPISTKFGVKVALPLVSMQTSISWKASVVDVRLCVLTPKITLLPDSRAPTARTSFCVTPCGVGWYWPSV
jgi:hypothetical protein